MIPAWVCPGDEVHGQFRARDACEYAARIDGDIHDRLIQGRLVVAVQADFPRRRQRQRDEWDVPDHAVKEVRRGEPGSVRHLMCCQFQLVLTVLEQRCLGRLVQISGREPLAEQLGYVEGL